MNTLIDGQSSIFDLLDDEPKFEFKTMRANSQRDRNPLTYSDKHFVPTPEVPVYCTMCGAEQSSYYDYQVNHNPLGWQAGTRTCTAMNLTRNHVTYRIGELEKAVNGETPQTCCWDKHGLHGKKVAKPTVEQVADHLNCQLSFTRSKWGIKAEVFDEWAVATLIDHGLLSYTKYWARYTWPDKAPDAPVKLPFTVFTGANQYDAHACAYCGSTKQLNEGHGGPAGTFPSYHYEVCDPCANKYRYLRPPSEFWTYKETHHDNNQ